MIDGLGVTLLISVASGTLGLALGFVFVLLRRKREGGVADKIITFFEKIMGGLPVVVILMVFYYVIFGSLSISGIIVAIIAFTLLFASSSGPLCGTPYERSTQGKPKRDVRWVSSDHDTFFLVVLPQAAHNFAPLLVNLFGGPIKDSSIVGYIAVQDLTRVGDLIRARTMEAFFPLIAIAIIYFAIILLSA